MMEKENEVLAKLLDALCEKNLTKEQKMICALVKKAIFADSLLTFVDEVSKAFNDCGKVKVETVKGVTEFFKANREVQIRNSNVMEKEKERLIQEASNRIVQGEVWVLGTLAHLGYLAE